ncbi:hypothetical protein DAPPUDRAFT_303924 [Daphnia pulex]|uniref:EGF-like domain-containing protein n=1 Tax=Daphnia pulex TaxID=6669 RepID=E9GIG2_DAPPU|nr:hypothetical protein DAPPUDRAFT_303924 [Daphnia pulex]|eukprot:EFX80773.1 hypothetical protein DAPPUDRAFT_303924 [Daphnia pulex]
MKFGGLFIFVALKLAAVVSVKQDDLIIAVGNKLEFLKDGSTYQTLALDSYNASKFSALAYDATTQKLFFSDIRHRHGHIFSVSLDSESRRNVEDIVEKKSNETVESLTYDPVDNVLLWTDGLNKSIRRIQIDHDRVHSEEKAGVEVVHFLEYDAKPRGLVSDPCTRMLYWTNIHNSRPTIERSFLNGSRREIVVETDLLLPNSLDLDVVEQRLYWAESLPNGYFHIERSFVNGTGRQEIYRGTGQFVVNLAVGVDYVYWSDYDHKKLWFLRKDGSSKRPLSLGTFRDPVMSVVLFRRQSIDCCLVSSSETCQPTKEVLVKSQPEVILESTSSKHDDVDICTGFCYHNGDCTILLNSVLRCSCPVGFSGDRCELLDGQSDAWSYDNPEVEEMDRENETMTLDQMSSSFETIAKTCIPITCFVLIAIFAIVKLRLFTTIFESLRRDKDDNAAVVQNLENCYKMCERPFPQLQAVNAPVPDNSWKQSGDRATLIENEF